MSWRNTFFFLVTLSVFTNKFSAITEFVVDKKTSQLTSELFETTNVRHSSEAKQSTTLHRTSLHDNKEARCRLGKKVSTEYYVFSCFGEMDKRGENLERKFAHRDDVGMPRKEQVQSGRAFHERTLTGNSLSHTNVPNRFEFRNEVKE